LRSCRVTVLSAFGQCRRRVGCNSLTTCSEAATPLSGGRARSLSSKIVSRSPAATPLFREGALYTALPGHVLVVQSALSEVWAAASA
jgi:hypothetical protein